MNPARQPQCQTCRFNVIQQYRVRGQITEAPGCEKHFPVYPEAVGCRDFEREPGTD